MNITAIVLLLTTLLMAGCNTPDKRPEISVPTVGHTAESAVTSLTKDEAQAIALRHAGVPADQAIGMRTEFEFDEGIPHYEIRFRYDGWEYDYEIHAETGEVLSFDRENR